MPRFQPGVWPEAEFWMPSQASVNGMQRRRRCTNRILDFWEGS